MLEPRAYKWLDDASDRDRHVALLVGDKLSIICKTAETNAVLAWHNVSGGGRRIDFGDSQSRVHAKGHNGYSKFIVTEAQLGDTGVYSCNTSSNVNGRTFKLTVSGVHA